ncbi:MAG: ubiquinol oxidase subunit II [Bradyrhizobium sp.]|nr:MAG: ubiquinol oxidase subunit II [Bradyrhizobium sp.]
MRAGFAALVLASPLAGCVGVLEPRGPVGASERLILFDSLAIMLAIVVPVVAATLGVAWWFRASNTRAAYWPDWAFSGRLELIVWAIPALVITFLGGIAWFGSQALDPFRPLGAKPVEVEVVSLDWRWLFIYPDAGVATINQLAIPVGTPVHFKLTSNGVMNSFFVPQLGGQIYTMAGMTSQLSLQADAPGSYSGLSANFSGDGFSDMRFEVRALSPDDFAKWIADAKANTTRLDTAAYGELARQSRDAAPRIYGAIDGALFDAIVNGQAPPAQGPAANAPGGGS